MKQENNAYKYRLVDKIWQDSHWIIFAPGVANFKTESNRQLQFLLCIVQLPAPSIFSKHKRFEFFYNVIYVLLTSFLINFYWEI